MVKLSVTQYADSKGISRQAVLERIENNNLPRGVKAEKVGNAWVLSMSQKHADKKSLTVKK